MALLRDHAEKPQISPAWGIFSVATSQLNRMHISLLMCFAWYLEDCGWSDCQIKVVFVVKISPEEGVLFPPSSGMFACRMCVCICSKIQKTPPKKFILIKQNICWRVMCWSTFRDLVLCYRYTKGELDIAYITSRIIGKHIWTWIYLGV